MPNFRRGAEAIAKAAEKSSGGGSFKPFTPSMFWANHDDSKYLLFLNPLSEIPEVDMIGFLPQKGKKSNGDEFVYYEQTIARTDPCLDNPRSTDPLVEKWDASPKRTCVAVAVELEPTVEEVNGRNRPTGFAVKTTSYDRRIRDEEGELTDEYETVEAPVIGFVTQSPHNFFNVVTSFDNNEGPIESTALKITRVGKDSSTTYTVNGYLDQTIDLYGLVDCTDGISYLTNEEREELFDSIVDLSDEEASLVIGEFMLDKRLDELADDDRYNELAEGVTASLDKFGGKSKKNKGAAKPARERPARRSQRRTPVEDSDGPAEDAPQEDTPAEDPKPARRTRAAKPKEDAPAEEKVNKQKSPEAMEKLNKLRDRTSRRQSASAA